MLQFPYVYPCRCAVLSLTFPLRPFTDIAISYFAVGTLHLPYPSSMNVLIIVYTSVLSARIGRYTVGPNFFYKKIVYTRQTAGSLIMAHY